MGLRFGIVGRGVLRLGVLVALPAALVNPTGTLGSSGGWHYSLPSRAAGTTLYSWPQFNGDEAHTGDNFYDSFISPSNVSQMKELGSVTLPATADGAPAVLTNVSTPTGATIMVYVTTKDGRILALDLRNGNIAWQHQYGPGSCRINNGSSTCYTTSSPAIDPSGQYVYSYGLDGKVHKYAAGTGTEITGGGWPEVATVKGYDEKGSSALSVAVSRAGTPYLYVANGGYPGDAGNYQGHVTTINLNTGQQHVFNTLCSNQVNVHINEAPNAPTCSQSQSAVWGRGAVMYDPQTDRIYFSTGNGDFNPSNHDWGDSVLALNPDGTGNAGFPLDSYTPTNYQSLQNSDQDLGSTTPALLPLPSTSAYQYVAVQAGKDGRLRLINLDNMSGQSGAGHTGGEIGNITFPPGGAILPQPAIWVNPTDLSTWVFVSGYNGMSGLKVTYNSAHVPTLTAQWTQSQPASSMLLVNNVLFSASSGVIQARNPVNGQVLWQSTAIGSIHWQSPVVTDGVLFQEDNNGRLFAFAP